MGRCARWSWTSPRRPLRRGSCPMPEPGPRATCCSRCTPAAFAGPTCMSATARCGDALAAGPGPPDRPASASTPARASASRGWAGPTGRAATAPAGARTSASRAVHRPGPRRRLRRVHGRRRALRLRPARRIGDLEAAPLLCAGAHRALRTLRLAATRRAWGSTASATRRTSSARSPWAGPRVFAFTRAGRRGARRPSR